MIRTSIATVVRGLALAGLLTAGQAHADALAQLKQFMDGTRTARGSFTQQVLSKSGRKPQQASGTFAFSRPGKFRWGSNSRPASIVSAASTSRRKECSDATPSITVAASKHPDLYDCIDS